MSTTGRIALSIGLLLAVWLLMLVSLEPLDVLIGLAVSAGVLALSARLPRARADRDLRPPGLLSRIVAFPAFAWMVVLDITRGTWTVLAITTHIRPLEEPGLVEVPIGDRSPLGVAVSSLTATLSPGELLVDVDHDRDVMIFHAIDASDPDGIRAHHAHMYDRYQRRVFP